MSHTLTVNTTRPNPQLALVASPTQPYTPKAFPHITDGESIDIELQLVTTGGAIDSRSGAAGYTPKIEITLPSVRPNDGTFTTGDSGDSAAIDFDANSQDIEASLNALNDGAGPFDDQCSVMKFANGMFSVLFDSDGAKDLLTVSAKNIRPVSTSSVESLVDGDATTRSEQLIRIIADPLIAENDVATITDAWTMTLDADNANMLRAMASEQDDMSANYAISLVRDDSTIDVLARGPIILKQSNNLT